MIKDHVLHNICSGNKDTFQYLMEWLRQAVSSDAHCRVAIVLRGSEGCGKTFFGHTILAHLFGNGTLALRSSISLNGFNSSLNGCRYLFLDDEPSFPRYGAIIKSLLCEPRIIIETQGQDPVVIDNHVHIMMSVGPDWKPPSNIDERQFFVIDIPPRWGINYGPLVMEGIGDLMDEDVDKVECTKAERAFLDRVKSCLGGERDGCIYQTLKFSGHNLELVISGHGGPEAEWVWVYHLPTKLCDELIKVLKENGTEVEVEKFNDKV